LLAAFPTADAKTSTLVPPPHAHTFGIRRVTTKEIGIFVPSVRIQSPGGIATALLEATDQPGESGDDDEVTLVALDAATGSLFTNFGLLKAGSWNGEDSAVGPLSRPSDVAIDREGRVAVTDTGNRRVVLLTHDGRSLHAVRAFDGFLEPTGIAPDGRGGFWVCDRRFNTVFHLDTSTGDRTTFGLEVAFDRPIACATIPHDEKLPSGHQRVLVVVDQDGQRLRSFDPSGVLRGTLDAASVGDDGASFDAIDLDYYGNVYAVDRGGDRLHKLRRDLFLLDTFGARGTDEGQFLAPRGIAIHRKLGQVFVTEEDGGQYLWVGTDVRRFRADDQGEAVAFSFVLTEESTLDFRILDAQGKEVAIVIPGRRHPAGPQKGTWDGTDASGRPSPPGDYLAEIRARATYASRSTFEKKFLRTFTLGRSEP
jgi:sugar lactone lactonase YvrE